MHVSYNQYKYIQIVKYPAYHFILCSMSMILSRGLLSLGAPREDHAYTSYVMAGLSMNGNGEQVITPEGYRLHSPNYFTSKEATKGSLPDYITLGEVADERRGVKSLRPTTPIHSRD